MEEFIQELPSQLIIPSKDIKILDVPLGQGTINTANHYTLSKKKVRCFMIWQKHGQYLFFKNDWTPHDIMAEVSSNFGFYMLMFSLNIKVQYRLIKYSCFI